MCWIGLGAAAQYGLFVQLIYPASLGVALVLLFDKATRTWSVKGSAELVREWLLCDLLMFLLVLSFLNLRGIAKPEAYAGSFWDLLNVVLFFAAFWALDRTAARSRFLVGYGYLVVLPVLLLIWQAIQGVGAAASWWASIWPFLILAGVFFVLEAVTLVSSSERTAGIAGRQGRALRRALCGSADHRHEVSLNETRHGPPAGATPCRWQRDVLKLAIHHAVRRDIRE